ncbi:MAG: hypothetical protein KKB51_17865 [Candidatus Riflebacteria bacterium]|nr:hypothetical protein [Candidatus Riflebacteria bacterium]
MKFFGAVSKYRKLSPDQQNFIRQGQQKFNNTPEKLLEFFKPMAEFDKSCDEARDQLLNYIFICVALIFLGVIGIAVSSGHPLAFMLPVILFFMIFLIMFLRWMLGRIDIHNNLRGFVVPIINLLGQDMTAGQKIILDLDLRGKKLPSKLKQCVKDDPGWFSYPKTTTSTFEDPWFNLTTELVDGSKLMLTVDDEITQLDRTRKNARGKIKSKSKDKIKHMIRASLALKHKKYAVATQNDIEKFGSDLKLKNGQNRQIFGLKHVVKGTDVEANLDPKLCFELLGRVFMNVQPAQQKGS